MGNKNTSAKKFQNCMAKKNIKRYVIYPYYYYHFILKVKSENPTEFGIHTPLLDGSNAIFVLECSLR